MRLALHLAAAEIAATHEEEAATKTGEIVGLPHLVATQVVAGRQP